MRGSLLELSLIEHYNLIEGPKFLDLDGYDSINVIDQIKDRENDSQVKKANEEFSNNEGSSNPSSSNSTSSTSLNSIQNHTETASTPSSSLSNSWISLPPHKDEDQIRLDVDRSFVFYPPLTGNELKTRQNQLSQLICAVLRKHPSLSYYQGYHDIAQVILLVFGPTDLSIAVLDRMTMLYLRDFMLPSLNASLDHLALLPSIISQADPILGDILKDCRPFYALSSILTIFSHDLRSYSDICSVFDFILASRNMTLPIYLYAALILTHRPDILALNTSDPDILHSTLANLCDNKFNSSSSIFDLTNRATMLYNKYPPQDINEWNDISEFSVLKTSSLSKSRPQPLADSLIITDPIWDYSIESIDSESFGSVTSDPTNSDAGVELSETTDDFKEGLDFNANDNIDILIHDSDDTIDKRDVYANHLDHLKHIEPEYGHSSADSALEADLSPLLDPIHLDDLLAKQIAQVQAAELKKSFSIQSPKTRNVAAIGLGRNPMPGIRNTLVYRLAGKSYLSVLQQTSSVLSVGICLGLFGILASWYLNNMESLVDLRDFWHNFVRNFNVFNFRT